MTNTNNTMTVQWPVWYVFPPGTAGHYPPRQPLKSKALEKIERLLCKAIER